MEIAKEIGILVGVCVWAFWSVFVRIPFGYDSYAWISLIRGYTTQFGGSAHIGADLFFTLLPNNPLVWNILLFASFFVSVAALYFGLKQKFSPRVTLAAVLVLLAGAPIFLFEFAKFENEFLAFPFIFISFYFLMRDKKWDWLISIIIGLLAAPFWMGAWIWVGIIIFGYLFEMVYTNKTYLLLIISAGLIIGAFNIDFISRALITAFGFQEGVAFNTWFWGLSSFFVLFPFIFGCFLDKNNKRLIGWSLIGLICVILSARFVLLFIPFLGLGVGAIIIWLSGFKNNVSFGWLFNHRKDFSFKNLAIVCVFLMVCWNVALLLQHPSPNEMNLVKEFIKECDGKKCYNDWSYGWWIQSEGGSPSHKAGIPDPDYEVIEKPYLALSSKDLNCDLVKKEGILIFYSCS